MWVCRGSFPTGSCQVKCVREEPCPGCRASSGYSCSSHWSSVTSQALHLVHWSKTTIWNRETLIWHVMKDQCERSVQQANMSVTSFLTCCHSRVLCRRSLAASTRWTHSQGSGSTQRGQSHWELHRSQGWSCPSPPSPRVPGSLSRTWSWTQYYQNEPPWFWTAGLFSPQVLRDMPVRGPT